jgi:integrase
MSRRGEGLQLRGSVWWLRLRVPEDLWVHTGKREIHRSLRTSDYSEAKLRVRHERLKIDAEWQLVRRRQKPLEVEDLDEREMWYLATRWFVAEERRNQGLALDEDQLHEAEVDLTYMSNRNVVGSSITTAIRGLLHDEGIKLAEHSPAYRRLSDYIGAAMVEAQKRLLQRHHWVSRVALDPQFAGITASTEVTPVAKTTFRDLVLRYRDDRTRRPVSDKTRLKQQARLRFFEEFFGSETPLHAIDRTAVRDFVNLLTKLPDNVGKRLPGVPIRQAADIASERKLAPMATETANGYLAAFAGLLRYAVAEQLIGASPAEGLRLQAVAARTKDKRLPFSIADLNRIFSAPLYRGCVDDEDGYASAGPNVVRRGRFWVPLVALFTGMRLNEICQLSISDVSKEDGVTVILVRGDDDDETKRVKTAAGERFVPIHPELKALGFLRYVAQRQRAGQPKDHLFPELSLASTGYASDNFSKWFARFSDKIGLTDRRKVFHSFRHTYRDALREADVSAEKVRALGGWASGRVEDQYGSGLRASTLAKDIRAIGYPGLNLSHLYTPEKHHLPKFAG